MKAQQIIMFLVGMLLMLCHESASQESRRYLTIDHVINFKKILEPQVLMVSGLPIRLLRLTYKKISLKRESG